MRPSCGMAGWIDDVEVIVSENAPLTWTSKQNGESDDVACVFRDGCIVVHPDRWDAFMETALRFIPAARLRDTMP